MANIEEKLNQFSTLVLKDATMQREEMMKRFEKEKKHRIDKEENEILADAYADIQNMVETSRRENNERVLKVEMELKKELIQKREHMIDDVFSDVQKKIESFIGSADYGAWLAKRAEAAISELGDGKKTVYLTQSDMQYGSAVKQKHPEIDVEQSEDDFIGGLRAFNEDKQISIDCSIETMLREEREGFLQKSGLSIH